MKRWQRLARMAGRMLSCRVASMDDYRMWHRLAQRYSGGFTILPAAPLAYDIGARWWARWLWWV